MKGFSPASFGAGFGAGSTEARGLANGEIASAQHNAAMAKIEAEGAADSAKIQAESAHNTSLALAFGLKKARDEASTLQGEIRNRWIPYAVKLNASLVANRAGRQDLIDELKRLDPANAENVVRQSEQHADAEYAALEGEKLRPIIDDVMEDSEKSRLDK